MNLVPKKWAEFQHYKDRSPPWIKLHRDLLNDRLFMSLPLASKALAPLLWLLASESKDGAFDANHAELAFRLRLTEEEVVQGLGPLISKGFFLDASTMLAPCVQLAIPETEGETEGETKKPAASPPFVLPEWIDKELWDTWHSTPKRKKATMNQKMLAVKKLTEWRDAGLDYNFALESAAIGGWQGLFEPKPANSTAYKTTPSGVLAGAI